MTGGDRIGNSNRLNFRSLDGIVLSGGMKMASSRLFRSAAPEPGNVSEFAELVRSHGIRTVVDLRTTDERAQSVGILERLITADWISIPLFETIEQHWANPSDLSPKATSVRYLEMLVSGVPSIIRILDLASEPGTAPILFHCAKGRDRTGIVVASILMLLGADPDSVSEDYQVYPSTGHDDPPPQKGNILELFKLIEIRYGSILEMLSELSGRTLDIQKLGYVFRERL